MFPNIPVSILDSVFNMQSVYKEYLKAIEKNSLKALH